MYNTLRKIAQDFSLDPTGNWSGVVDSSPVKASWEGVPVGFVTPSSSTPLYVSDPNPINRLHRVVNAAKAIADDKLYAKSFAAISDPKLASAASGLKLTRNRFSGTPYAKSWGDQIARNTTFSCMPFVSECFSNAHGGKPLWDPRTGKPALTEDINLALAKNRPLPIDHDNFNAYELDQADTTPVTNLTGTWQPYPAAVLPGFVKVRRNRGERGGGWAGHAGVTHGNEGTYQASTDDGVKDSDYNHWGFKSKDDDRAFTVMGKDIDPEHMARSLHRYMSASEFINPVRFYHFNNIIPKRELVPEDKFIAQFKRMNAVGNPMRKPNNTYKLPRFYK